MDDLYTKLDRWMSRWSIFETKTNVIGVSIYMTQKVGCVFSPLDKELVEMGLRLRSQKSGEHMIGNKPIGSLAIYSDRLYGYRRVGTEAHKSDSVWPYLLHPRELFGYVKRYHGSGSNFVWFGAIETILLTYLWTKTTFHQIYTGSDQKTADYYAERYFPRIFESYPYQHQLYGLLNVSSLNTLLIRFFISVKIIKRSIANRNGYKDIEISQLNGVFLASLKWPLRDWIKICFVSFYHYKVCKHGHTNRMSDARWRLERQAHLHAHPYSAETISQASSFEFICRENPIDFSKCYEFYGFDMNNRLPKWHYPGTNCRMDIVELSFIVWLTIIGTPLIIISILTLMIINLYIELAVLSANKFNSSLMDCIEQVPNLITSPKHLLRLFDAYILLAVQLPHHIEAATTYLDLGTLISRVRKLIGRLEEDLEMCKHYALLYHLKRENKDSHNLSSGSPEVDYFTNFRSEDGHKRHNPYVYGNISPHQRRQLNRSIEQSILMSETINNEFVALKKTITFYLDLLLIGGGFCIAVGTSAMIGAETNLIKLVVILSIVSCSGPLVVCSVLCMTIEALVSIHAKSNLSVRSKLIATHPK